jgi:CHAT domain-containing protein
MGTLYQRIGQGQPPADALRQAKLELLRSNGPYAKPYYWAAFLFFNGNR